MDSTKTFLELFEKKSINNHCIALICQNREFTYFELNQLSNKYANYFLSQGINSGDMVGLCLERNEYFLPSILGVLKIGAAYIPLDPNFPHSRLQYMVDDSELRTIVTQKNLTRIYKGKENLNLLCVDSSASKIKKQNGENPEIALSGENLVYMIYTSGSTGNPKGVQIQHKALLNFLLSMGKEPGIAPEDRLLALTTLSFDISGLELYLPLISGATVVLATSEQSKNPFSLIEIINKHNVTMMQATPATYSMLRDAEWLNNSVKKILCGGEALSQDLASYLFDQAQEVWNMYGPTETTIWSTIFRIEDKDTKPLIGKPIDNTTIYILDEELKSVAEGDAGDLYIGGEGLSLGYFHRTNLTSERFISYSREDGSVERIYKTGDVCCFNEDGILEYMGRSDFQVKIRGFRIELGEIEAALIKEPSVRNAVVVAKETSQGRKQLVAFVIAEKKKEFQEKATRDALAGFLPNYMVPSTFIVVDEYPLTPNEKIDRKALTEQDIDCDIEDVTTAQRLEGINKENIAIVEKIESVLGSRVTSLNHSFVDIGGDSLSYIRVSLFVEKHLGYLPHGWEKEPLEVLLGHKHKTQKSGIWTEIDMPSLMRAIAIIFVVISHLDHPRLPAASVLFVLSGISFGQYLRPTIFRRRNLSGTFKYIFGYGFPVFLWNLLNSIIDHRFWLPDFFLFNTMYQKPGDGHVGFWFLDILTISILILSVVSLLEAYFLRRINIEDQSFRFKFDLILIPIAIVLGLIQHVTGWWNGGVAVGNTGPFPWFWLITFGTAIASSSCKQDRWFLTGVLVIPTVSTFVEIPIITPAIGFIPFSTCLIILLLIWVDKILFPKGIKEVMLELASASLFIYIVHMKAMETLESLGFPSWGILFTIIGLLAGVIAYRVWNNIYNRCLIMFNRLRKRRVVNA